MLAIGSTPRVSAIAAAAVAGACLLLSACGGGSAGGSTAGSSSSSGGGSTPAASSAASVPGLPSAKLTGHFCKDFTNLSHNLPKVPTADKNNLSALQANGGGFFKS